MKIAVTGKGGTGKTTITGVLARTLAPGGPAVVAVDADPNPNLAITLGLGLDAAAQVQSVTNVLLHDKAQREMAAAHAHSGGKPHEHPDPQPHPEGIEDLLAAIGVTCPDGVRLIQTGVIERPAEGCLCCGSHRTSRRVFDEIDGSERVVVADLEAGVIDLMWVWPKPEDWALVVTEPYIKSLEVARRALEVAHDFDVANTVVVANRVADRADAERVRKYFPSERIAEIPDDPAILRAAQLGVSPVDHDPASPAVAAVADLAHELLRTVAPVSE